MKKHDTISKVFDNTEQDFVRITNSNRITLVQQEANIENKMTDYLLTVENMLKVRHTKTQLIIFIF